MNSLQELLTQLVETPGVTGREGPVAELIRDRLGPLGRGWNSELEEIGAGNLALGVDGAPCTALGPHGGRTLMVAHMDELGLLVSAITGEGFLHAEPVGSFWPELWVGRSVVVDSAAGRLTGVTCAPAYHLDSGGSRPGDSAAELLVDIGAESAEHAREMGVRPGDPVSWKKHPGKLGDERFAGRGLDDRFGCAALLELLQSLDETGCSPADPDGAELVLAWSVQEEEGLRGAQQLERALNSFDTVIPLDIFASNDSPLESGSPGGSALGNGACIRGIDHTTIAGRGLIEQVLELAARTGAELQQESFTTGGGNDGSVWFPSGAAVLPLGVPVRYTHATEVIDLRDLRNLIRLLTAIATG